MKTKWYSFLFLSLVLLLTSSVVGCGESYTQEDLESKYEALLLEKAILKAELETMQADITYLRADYDALKVLYEDVKNELSEVRKSSEPESSSEVTSMFDAGAPQWDDIPSPELPSKFPTELEAGQAFEDLAYIKASTWRYSDDADPEWEGVSISLSYYNSKSELITPSGVSVQVIVELYWYTNHPSIYQKQVTINYTGALSELLKEVIRIPYEGIGEKPSGMTRGPILILTVNTPNQGNFQVQVTISGLFWP